ncbi:MAG: DUF393 domain-containing protein [Phycisphaeraceae bacterium]|nr:DUF393 domain-containing protein [Phycisphaeraceae bacterium]
MKHANSTVTRNHGIVLFDGICNLCSASVNFIIKRDPADYFRFAALQSDTGRSLLREYQLEEGTINSMVLIQNGKTYIRSSAAVRIASHLCGFWKALVVFMIVPPLIRDVIYSFIAKHRHRWLGNTEACNLLTSETSERFL